MDLHQARRPVHLYKMLEHSVSLVYWPWGESTEIKTDLITVTSPSLPPIVSFSAEPTAGILPLEVVLVLLSQMMPNLFCGILETVPLAQN